MQPLCNKCDHMFEEHYQGGVCGRPDCDCSFYMAPGDKVVSVETPVDGPDMRIGPSDIDAASLYVDTYHTGVSRQERIRYIELYLEGVRYGRNNDCR